MIVYIFVLLILLIPNIIVNILYINSDYKNIGKTSMIMTNLYIILVLLLLMPLIVENIGAGWGLFIFSFIFIYKIIAISVLGDIKNQNNKAAFYVISYIEVSLVLLIFLSYFMLFISDYYNDYFDKVYKSYKYHPIQHGRQYEPSDSNAITQYFYRDPSTPPGSKYTPPSRNRYTPVIKQVYGDSSLKDDSISHISMTK